MINNAISETESAPSWSQPDATPLLEENYGDEKKGHSFFGFCCDSRRATIIVNILSLILFIACVSCLWKMLWSHILAHMICAFSYLSYLQLHKPFIILCTASGSSSPWPYYNGWSECCRWVDRIIWM